MTSEFASTLSRSLGVASLVLGATELLAPDAVLRTSGIPSTSRARRAVRALGLRECAHGGAIFAKPALVWTRVAGDALDVALLAKGLASPGARRGRGAVVAAVLTVIGAADVVAAAQHL
jgi:hypothetical protein